MSCLLFTKYAFALSNMLLGNISRASTVKYAPTMHFYWVARSGAVVAEGNMPPGLLSDASLLLAPLWNGMLPRYKMTCQLRAYTCTIIMKKGTMCDNVLKCQTIKSKYAKMQPVSTPNSKLENIISWFRQHYNTTQITSIQWHTHCIQSRL